MKEPRFCPHTRLWMALPVSFPILVRNLLRLRRSSIGLFPSLFPSLEEGFYRFTIALPRPFFGDEARWICEELHFVPQLHWVLVARQMGGELPATLQ